MGVVKVKKGNEVFEIQDTDLKDAVKDGYLPTDTVIVANSKTKEMFEIAPEDLPDAFSDGFDFSGVKKKVGGIGSAVGGAVGTSVPQSEKQKLTDYLYGLKTKEEKQLAAPTTGITTTLKQKPKKVDEQALNTINTIMYEDSDRWKDPVKSIIEESKSVSKFEDLDVYNRAAELTRNSLAGSGYKAKVLLADTFLNAERDNMTASMLKNRAEQYDKISEPFRNLQFFEGNTITDNPDLDYNAKDKLYDAAIRAYANKYPLFGKQAEAAGIDLSSTDLRRKLGDKGYAGIVMSDILQDKDFVDFVQNENPKYLNVVQNAANDLLKDNREYGINVVANEISKERQKLGLNNPIVEFDDKRFRDETDLVAQKLYGNDPVKMQIYEEVIKRNPDQYLDTPSLIEGISQGAEGVYKGIGTSFEAPFTSISNQIKEGWEKEASNVTADPKGVSKFLSGTGHVLGLVGALGGVGNVIGGGGTGLYSQKIAPFLSGTVPFAGDFWKEAVMKYPDSPAKAALSTTLNTALYGALSQRIFPTKQVQQAFENVKPEIGQIVENLASGKITREVARREANTLIKQGFDFLKGTVSKSAKISAELTGITAANRALDKLFMDEQDFEKYHPEDELQDSFKTLFLDNLVLGGMTKYSDMKKGNAIVEESLYEAATNPLRYKRVIDEMEVKDPTISKEDMLNNLGFLSMLKTELDKRGIAERNQKRYLFEAMKEKAIKQELSQMPESNITRRGQEQILRGQEIKNDILNGENVNEETLVDENYVNPLPPKETIAKAVADEVLTGAEAEAFKKGEITEEDILLSLAQQKYGVLGDGSISPTGGRDISMKTSLDVDEAVEKIYPNAQSVQEAIQKQKTSQQPSISVQMPEEVAKPEMVEPQTAETTESNVTFENAKKGDRVIHNGVEVEVIGKTKSRGGRDIIEVKDSRKRSKEEMESAALQTVYNKKRGEYGNRRVTEEDIKNDFPSEYRKALEEEIQKENSRSSSYTIDAEQWAKEVSSKQIPSETITIQEAAKTTVSDVTFETAKEGDVVLYLGEKVTVGGKEKMNNGNEGIQLKNSQGGYWVVDKEIWDKNVEPAKTTASDTESLPVAAKQAETKVTEDWSKDVESTAKALEDKFKSDISNKKQTREEFVIKYYEGVKADMEKRGNWSGFEKDRVIENSIKDLDSAKKGKPFSNFLLEEVYKNGYIGVQAELSVRAKKQAEAYHKSKADGTNPELVKAVEDLLGKPQAEAAKTTVSDAEELLVGDVSDIKGMPDKDAADVEWYHGTTKDFDEISEDFLHNDLGIFLTSDKRLAEEYTKETPFTSEPKIGKVKSFSISPKKTYDIRFGRTNKKDISDVFDALIERAKKIDEEKDGITPTHEKVSKAKDAILSAKNITEWKAAEANMYDSSMEIAKREGGYKFASIAPLKEELQKLGFDTVRKVDDGSDTLVVLDYTLIKPSKKSEGDRSSGVDAANTTTKALPVAAGQAETKVADSAKQLANKVRSLKINLSKLGDGGLQSNPLGLPVAVWNGAMDIVAKTIEAGGQVADAVKRGLNYIQKNHRGQWDKKGFNDQVLKELGVRGITVNGQDLIVKDVEPEFAETINGFYSDIEQSILDVSPTDKGTPQAWQKKIGTGEEAKWTGITDWLNSLPKDQKLSRQEILQWLKDNRIQVVEVVKGVEQKVESQILEDETYNNINDELSRKGIEDEEGILDAWYYAEENKNEKWGNVVDFLNKNNLDLDYLIEKSEINASAVNDTKFSQYQLEGEKGNYKEVLVTLPVKELDLSNKKIPEGIIIKDKNNKWRLSNVYDPSVKFNTKEEAEKYYHQTSQLGKSKTHEDVKFKSSHFDEPNILVHLRMNTRTNSDGKKVLFLEEIQSDWGQKGKKEGFIDNEKLPNKSFIDYRQELFDKYKTEKYNDLVKVATQNEVSNLERLFAKENGQENLLKTVPIAPFVTETPSWTKLGLKVALKEAVKQGADKIAWSTGTQQFDRWGSEEIHWSTIVKPKGFEIVVKDDAKRPIVRGSRIKLLSSNDGSQDQKTEVKRVAEKWNLKPEDLEVVPSRGKWILAINEQTDAQAFQGNEEALRSNKLEESDILVGTKEELRDAIKRNLSRERNDAEIDKLTNRIWDRMQKEESGTSLPRKEGMEAFYGSPSEGKLGIVGEVAKSLFKQEIGKAKIEIDRPKLKVNEDKLYINGKINPKVGEIAERLIKEANEKLKTELTPDQEFAERNILSQAYRLLEAYNENDPNIANVINTKSDYLIKQFDYYKEPITTTQHAIDITPELKAEVQSGLPLFKDIKGRGKAIADALRKGKIKMGGLQSNIAGIPAALWNAAIDTIALAIEGGATLAQAVQKAIKKHNLDKQKGFNQKEFISKLEQASGEKLTAETPPVEPPPTEMAGMQETEQIRLTHADTEQIYDAAGLPLRANTPVKEKEKLEQEAEEILKKGYDFDKVAEETMIGDKVWEDTDQILFARKVADLKAQQKGLDINSPEFDALQKKIEKYSRASDLAGTIGGRFLQSRKHYQPLKETLADYVMQEKEDAKVSVLTEKQKETLQKEFNDIQQAQMFYEQKMQALKEEYEQKLAEAAVNNVAKTTKKGQKKDFKKEREEIFASIKDKLKKARSETSVVAVPYAKELIAIAPDVAKLVKSYVEQGITELSEIVKNIKADLGDDKITERDIRGMIAGEYNEQKPTRNKLAADLVSLKQEAKLINQLEEYELGGEPKSETKKIERNRKIDEIKAKLKPYTDLKAYKTKTKTEIEKIQKQMQTGDYSVPQKKPPLKLDKEAMELRDNLIRVKQQREARRLLVQRQNEGSRERALRKVAEVANIPRTLMTIGDFSGLLRQNIFFSAGHPIRTAQALPGMFKAAVSQKEYDRWFADLRESDKYQLIKDSKLAISDSLSHDLSEREEDFMSTLAEKIPVIGRSLKTESGKTIVPGLNIVKGSERSYTMLLNKMRVDVFLNLAEKLENRGITFENSPKVYKALAEYVNNATGRSDFGKHLNRIAPILNSAFFSPRLIASRINMLTYWAQPRFWKTLPKEARIDYFRNWLSLLATGMTILALAKMGGADVEDDPRSSDFGKIKSGNTRWDIWGGAQPYVRVIAQVATGQRKSTNTGKIYELSGDDIFGETRAGVASDFFRNKLAPVPGMMVDVLSGRTSIGDKIVYQWGGAGEKEISIDQYLKQRLLPMTITGTEEAMKDQGTKALFTAGVPQIFGVGTQTYEQKEETTKKPTRKERIQKRREKRQQGN